MKMRDLLALSVTLFVVLSGPVMGQEWTPDKDQVVEQPKPHSVLPARTFCTFGDEFSSALA